MSLGFLGGYIGWTVGGPIGAIIGAGIGFLLDGGISIKQLPGGGSRGPFESPFGREGDYRGRGQSRGRGPQRTGQGDFYVSLLVLFSAVMKADGKVLKSELNYVKRFMAQQVGEEQAKQYIKLLRGILKKSIPLPEVGRQIAYEMAMPMRLQLLHSLFGVAKSDGDIDKREVDLIEEIAGYLRIPERDFLSIKSMFVKVVNSAYKILEIDKSASDKEVKKAYRRMANRYHPDKVSQLGPEVQKGAKEKFQKIQEAYEYIKKKRGMK